MVMWSSGMNEWGQFILGLLWLLLFLIAWSVVKFGVHCHSKSRRYHSLGVSVYKLASNCGPSTRVFWGLYYYYRRPPDNAQGNPNPRPTSPSRQTDIKTTMINFWVYFVQRILFNLSTEWRVSEYDPRVKQEFSNSMRMRRVEEEYAKCRIKLNLDKFWLICWFKETMSCIPKQRPIFGVLKFILNLETGSVSLFDFEQTNPSIHFAILLVNWFQNI